MKQLLPFCLFIVFICSCSHPDSAKPSILARDTTIQPGNAFTLLKLDSTDVEQFLLRNVDDDSLKNKLTSFYNARNYQYAWFTEDGLSEAGQAFWNLHQQQAATAKDSAADGGYLHTAMRQLLNEDDASLPPDSVRQLELNLTLHFFRYVKTAFGGTVSPEEAQWHIPKRKLNATALLDSFLTGNGKTFQPLNKSFYALQEKVKLYANAEKAGGWSFISMKTKTLKKGQSREAVVPLKKRLQMSGDLTNNDTGRLFTAALEEAVKKAQHRFGLQEDGIVSKALLEQLNVPAESRMQQLLINMERMRWLPAWPANRLVANIPEFRLHVYEAGKEALAMNIVVGRAANRTVIFSDELEYVVFSPYWNVPRSIVRNEIVPGMNRSSNYISRHNMEITGYSNGLPVVRQNPGESNALGRVKFIFPNRYSIYLHDTPAKTLFDRDSRAFSHGCVRVQEPFRLAQYLLRNDDTWTDAKIKSAMHREKEEWVKLSKKIPVYLLYLTAWVDEEGFLNFRDDIYGHDKQMAKRLFTNETNNE